LLEKPSEDAAPISYKGFDPALFNDVLVGSASSAASLPMTKEQ
jgi:hypothetical protein